MAVLKDGPTCRAQNNPQRNVRVGHHGLVQHRPFSALAFHHDCLQLRDARSVYRGAYGGKLGSESKGRNAAMPQLS